MKKNLILITIGLIWGFMCFCTIKFLDEEVLQLVKKSLKGRTNQSEFTNDTLHSKINRMNTSQKTIKTKTKIKIIPNKSIKIQPKEEYLNIPTVSIEEKNDYLNLIKSKKEGTF